MQQLPAKESSMQVAQMQVVQHVKSSSAKNDVLSLAMPILVCPECGVGMELKDPGVWCRDCGRTYSRDQCNGVIYFVEEESYTESFGLQWKTFSREQLDNDQLRDSESRLRQETGLFPEQIVGKIILDAGCGMGRFLDIVSRDGATLAVGVDLSSAVDVAAANLSDRDNVLIIKGDIFRLPFRRGSFDAVFSIGVLHHTPTTEQAFRALVPLVKPGGEIAISVYAATMKPGVGWAVSMFRRRFFRVFTRRLPKRLMLWWSLYCVPVLWVIDKIPIIRWIRYLFPAVIYKSYPLKRSVLDTFDIYATELESRHRPKEVFRWFREAGLTNIDLLDSEDGWVSVRGQAPAHSSLD
jgi:SAM-dependent methyltransferase